MKMLIFFLCVLLCFSGFNCDDFEGTLGHLTKNSRRNKDAQTIAVKDLIKRILPDHAKYFSISIDDTEIDDGKDFFKLESLRNGSVNIMGTNGVAAATGFNYYLKYYCKCHISWETQQLKMPEELPYVNVKIKFNDRFRYYQNVCTTSYSFVWWDWNQWEKHIDWMVMNSFNLVLAFNGQEAIWTQVYQELGLSQDDIDDYFTGPAFLSWLRMGNVRKWGGPLSLGWHERSFMLQKAIVKRLRSFGVVTVLPAFAGHLPRAFKRLYPNVSMVKLGAWNDFNDTYCCPYFLNPMEQLFQVIGKKFIQKQIDAFGTDNIYSCDSFNENTPPSGNLSYLSNVSKAIFGAMTSADSKAIWLMQNWLFVNEVEFWSKDRAKALITAIPKGHMIILDLQSEQFPQYFEFEQYFGQPYIWCMLHNFGGTLGMYGNSDIINERPIKARLDENSTMIGTGLTMEGINQNYVIYDLMTETAWRNEPANLGEWFTNYTIRRYGKRNDDVIDVWLFLQKTVYNLKTLRRMRGQYAVTRTPSWSIKTWIWYDANDLYKNIDKFIKAYFDLKTSDGYKHDVVDLFRQNIQVYNDQIYNWLRDAYRKKNVAHFQMFSEIFLNFFDGMEKILSSNKAFSLSEWVKSARKAATNPSEKDWFEYNARNQITLWGPNGEIMNYAIKQWSGVVSDFIAPRWRVFLQYANETLITNTTFDEKYIRQKMFKDVEEPFTFKKSQAFVEATGDITDIVEEYKRKWYYLFQTVSNIRNKDLYRLSKSNFSAIRNLLNPVSFTNEDQIEVQMIRR
ncbi:hypothetical protein WA026_009478 [Henosepilachna vigintioctopunctata]|uniref:Alpha-N-acetylglucosaminidase n=1 Tax=Henosepilachna vigintioctopunctata TaxID=420089 RepID=A0AAW1TVT5_9CUCU